MASSFSGASWLRKSSWAKRDADDLRHVQKIDRDNLASAVGGADALGGDLAPAAGRRAEIDHGHAGFEKMVLVVDFDQLVGRARAQAVALGLRHIGIVELPLQPEFRGQLPLAAALDGDAQPPGGVFCHVDLACLGTLLPLRACGERIGVQGVSSGPELAESPPHADRKNDPTSPRKRDEVTKLALRRFKQQPTCSSTSRADAAIGLRSARRPRASSRPACPRAGPDQRRAAAATETRCGSRREWRSPPAPDRRARH